METILNELSVENLSNSVEEARLKMIEIIQLLQSLNEYNFNRLRLPDSNFFQVELTDDYTINSWLNDNQVSQNLKTLFMGYKIYPFFDELNESSETQYIASTFTLNEPVHPSHLLEVHGLADAYLRDALAVSFQSHPVWAKCKISINVNNEQNDVVHISTNQCINNDFIEWHKTKTRPPLNSHADVDFWFPIENGYNLSIKSKDDLIFWYQQNHMQKISKIESFLLEIKKTPFEGSGQIEPLRENLAGWWSRRINQEHRLVYRYENDVIIVCSCRGHYENLQCQLP